MATASEKGIQVSTRRLAETVELRFDGLDTVVTVRVYECLTPDFEKGRYEFDTSHFVQTPTQAGPYISSRNREDSLDATLRRGIETITSFIEGAQRVGHVPSDTWFVRNEFFVS